MHPSNISFRFVAKRGEFLVQSRYSWRIAARAQQAKFFAACEAEHTKVPAIQDKDGVYGFAVCQMHERRIREVFGPAATSTTSR
jgi:hypothetical protein